MTLVAFSLCACADVAVFHAPATFVGLATKPREGPDFVKESRPESTSFTSVGIETGHPPEKPRDAAGVKQLQAELEAQRTAGHALLQSMSPQPPPTPAADPKAKAAAQTPAAKQKKKEEAAAKPNKQAPDSSEAPQ